MATLTELTAEIVSAHASSTSLSSEELINNIKNVYNMLKGLEVGVSFPADEPPVVEAPTAPTDPIITLKQAFKNKDTVLCMICGKGFKTLKIHLLKAHDLKPVEYRKQFGIPSTQSLAAKSYVESRRKMALEKGLGAGLVKYRLDKKADSEAKIVTVPVVKKKAPVPAVKVKADLPATIEVTKAPTKAKKAPAVKPTVKAKK